MHVCVISLNLPGSRWKIDKFLNNNNFGKTWIGKSSIEITKLMYFLVFQDYLFTVKIKSYSSSDSG